MSEKFQPVEPLTLRGHRYEVEGTILVAPHDSWSVEEARQFQKWLNNALTAGNAGKASEL